MGPDQNFLTRAGFGQQPLNLENFPPNIPIFSKKFPSDQKKVPSGRVKKMQVKDGSPPCLLRVKSQKYARVGSGTISTI